MLVIALLAALALAGGGPTRTRAVQGSPGRPGPAAVKLDADGFRLAVPPYAFAFPADHAAHPAFRTEWWYYTGHLRSGTRRFGYELTFFRVALPRAAPGPGAPGFAAAPSGGGSAWRARQLIFRHLAVTDEGGHRFLCDDHAERQALQLAGADSTRYLVWLGDDYAGLEPDHETHRLVGRAGGFALDLHLVPERPPVVHGHGGVSQKTAGEGNASHYYSFTRMASRGKLVLGADTLDVEGRSWMDHEFSSDQLRGTVAGWDWFSIQLDDGRDLMLYELRRPGGGLDTCSAGTLVEADGRARYVPYGDFETASTGAWRSPHTSGRYPSGWIVRLPKEALELRLEPALEDQELVAKSMGGLAYWEGSVRVSGTSGDRRVTGEGYVELTGYAGASPFQRLGLDSLRAVR
jgi:predicted secreted hydrolase